MCGRKAELAFKYGISVKQLDRYETDGCLKPILLNGELHYSDLRVALIAKAERLGFSFSEVRLLIAYAEQRSHDGLSCVTCHQRGVLVG